MPYVGYVIRADQKLEPFPCRCGCGQMVQPDPASPKKAYATDGCRERGKKAVMARVRARQARKNRAS